MITKEELKAFYENNLQKKLIGLEEARKNVKNSSILTIFLIVVPILAFILVAQEDESSLLVPPVMFLSVALFITGLVFLFKTTKKR